jgi:hypothetical protein
VGLAGLLAVAWLVRLPLTGAAVTAGLRRAGAGEIKFQVTSASPWEVQLADVAFRIKTQQYAAKRITFERNHWWQSTLGAVKVEGARVPLVVDGSDVNPSAWPSYAGPAAAESSGSVPADELSVDGVLAIQAASLPEQALTLKFDARQTTRDVWTATALLRGAGVAADADGRYELADQRLAFQVTNASLDLKVWQDFIRSAVVIPGGVWNAAGRLSGRVDGSYADHKLTAGGTVALRDGSFNNPARGVATAGVEADFVFTDFGQLRSKPGSLRARELSDGAFVATDLAFALAFNGPYRIDVASARLRTLGGSLTAEPFTLRLDQAALEATVLADGLDIAEILALSQGVPATAFGRVNGRLPLRIDSAGLRFGTGWLELKNGVRAEVQLKAAGLLTNGVSQTSPTYPLLQKVESGLLRLHLTELRIDVRPPNAPPGRSAQIHLAGEPVDPAVKAPVSLDINVNGPLEQLINLGMDKRMSFGPAK